MVHFVKQQLLMKIVVKNLFNEYQRLLLKMNKSFLIPHKINSAIKKEMMTSSESDDHKKKLDSGR